MPSPDQMHEFHSRPNVGHVVPAEEVICIRDFATRYQSLSLKPQSSLQVQRNELPRIEYHAVYARRPAPH